MVIAVIILLLWSSKSYKQKELISTYFYTYLNNNAKMQAITT